MCKKYSRSLVNSEIMCFISEMYIFFVMSNISNQKAQLITKCLVYYPLENRVN